MSFAFHSSPQQKFDQQYLNAQSHVLPFIEESGLQIVAGLRVLEIGCGEGGVLKAFTDKGCICVGVDLSAYRIENAKTLMPEEVNNGKVAFLTQNVYEPEFLAAQAHQYDLIILKDAIEHIPEQEKFIPYLANFLRPRGKIFFGFPPWCMPFGGHQQIAKSKIASKLPYYHLLPYPIYKAVLKAFGESEQTLKELIEVKDTGISTYRFEKIVRQSGYQIAHKTFYLTNPIYQYKFGIRTRKQIKPLYYLPGIRDFVTMCVYYLIEKHPNP